MRRITVRIMLATFLLCVMAAIGSTSPAGATNNGGPPPCDASRDGQRWVDPVTGVEYVCVYTGGDGWQWDFPVGYAFGRAKTQYCSGTVCVANLNQNGFWGGSQSFRSNGHVRPLNQNRDSVIVDTGNLAVANSLSRWDGSAWQTCASTDFYYNSSPAYSLGIGWGWGASPPCGDGWYYSESSSYVWDGAGWRGGQLSSGIKFIGSLFARSVPPGPAPSSAPPERSDRPAKAKSQRTNPNTPGVIVDAR